jgi:hypothetical protein
MRKCELTNVTLLVLLGGATPCPYLPQDVAMVCGASPMMRVLSDGEWATLGLGDADGPPPLAHLAGVELGAFKKAGLGVQTRFALLGAVWQGMGGQRCRTGWSLVSGAERRR